MYMQDTLLRCITISLLPVGDEFGGPCFCPPLFLRSADALESNCRARTRIGIGREVEFTRIDAPSAIRTAIRRRLSFGKLVLSGRTVSGKPRRAGGRYPCLFRSILNRASMKPEPSQAGCRNSPHIEKLHRPPENQFKDFCERIRQCSKFFAFSALHAGAAISICPSRFADASIGWLGGAKRMESPGGNGTALRPGFSWQGRAEGNESSDQIAKGSFATLPDIDCAPCGASMGVGASRKMNFGFHRQIPPPCWR